MAITNLLFAVLAWTGKSEVCDGIDNDCDLVLSADEIDGDGDGYVSGVFSSGGWLGDPLVIGDQDCNDNVLEQHPGAAYNDSTTECLLDSDGDGFAPITDFCYQMEFVDSSGVAWQTASVQVFVDGTLHALYGPNSGNITESDCVSGVNIEWQISFADSSIADAGLTIYDVDGTEQPAQGYRNHRGQRSPLGGLSSLCGLSHRSWLRVSLNSTS